MSANLKNAISVACIILATNAYAQSIYEPYRWSTPNNTNINSNSASVTIYSPPVDREAENRNRMANACPICEVARQANETALRNIYGRELYEPKRF
jgi:hypothetical protein